MLLGLGVSPGGKACRAMLDSISQVSGRPVQAGMRWTVLGHQRRIGCAPSWAGRQHFAANQLFERVLPPACVTCAC